MTLEICAACHETIHDQYIFDLLGKTWHGHCLRCTDCDRILTDKCFHRQGLFYCEEDFHRHGRYRHCSTCSDEIEQGDYYTQVWNQFYHWKCYQCCACSRQVQPGEQVYLTVNHRFLCQDDYFKRHNPMKSEEEYDKENSSLSNHLSHSSTSSTTSTSPKKRGPRTTIKSKQLEQLKLTFVTTPKPTRHIREELARTTGLAMRVIQVWFQNRRSKERRMKQSNGSRRQFYSSETTSQRISQEYGGFNYHSGGTNYHDAMIQERYPYDLTSTSTDYLPLISEHSWH